MSLLQFPLSAKKNLAQHLIQGLYPSCVSVALLALTRALKAGNGFAARVAYSPLQSAN
jgi:hypothetical protein